MIFFVRFPQIHGSVTMVMRMIIALLMMTIITCNCQESRSCSDLWRRETTTRRRSAGTPGGWRVEMMVMAMTMMTKVMTMVMMNVVIFARKTLSLYWQKKTRTFVLKVSSGSPLLCCSQQWWPKLCRKIFKPKNTETQMPVQNFRCLTRLSPMLKIYHSNVLSV